MTDILFARTRHEYGSYQDFHRLIELSDFPTCYVDEIPREGWKDKTVIVTPINGEWQQGIQTDARVILWQMEWCTDGVFTPPPGVSEVWSSDAYEAERINARYVPMGSHPGLNIDPATPHEDIYDAAFLGYMTYRRQYLWDRLPIYKPAVTSAWGIDRHRILTKSRSYIHIHQLDNVPTLPPLRLVVAAAYRLPFITEWVDNPGGFAGLILQERYENMASNIRARLTRADLADFGEALHKRLCHEWTFRRGVEACV